MNRIVVEVYSDVPDHQLVVPAISNMIHIRSGEKIIRDIRINRIGVVVPPTPPKTGCC